MSFFSKLFGREPKTMDWRQFIQHFAERIRRDCAADVQIEWGESLEDTVLQVGEGRLYLGNHYARYLQNPADLDALLAANAAVVRQMMAERPPAWPMMPRCTTPPSPTCANICRAKYRLST